MKLIRFLDPHQSSPLWGVVEGTTVRELPQELAIDRIAAHCQSGSLPLGRALPRDDLVLLPPIDPGASLYCVGLNYRDHAEEMSLIPPERPVFFSRTRASIAPSDSVLFHPGKGALVDYEGELAIVMGNHVGQGTAVTWDTLSDYCIGFTLMNDCTARDIQLTEDQWFNAKNFRGFAPLGPELKIFGVHTVADLMEARLRLSILRPSTSRTAITRQDSAISSMIFSLPELINNLTERCDLFPGDIISTGTPAGIAMRKPPKKEKDESDTEFKSRQHRFIDDERTSNHNYLTHGDVVTTMLIDRNQSPILEPLRYSVKNREDNHGTDSHLAGNKYR